MGRKEGIIFGCLFVCLFCFLELQNLSVFFFPFEPHICFWIFRKLRGFREVSCLLQLLKVFCDSGCGLFFFVCRRKMAMAGVCAKVLQPVGGLRTQQQQQQRSGGAAVGRKKRTATRSSSSAAVSDAAAFSRARTISSYGTAAAAGRRCYYGSSGPLLCQATSSGGSRRDYQKIVARTQHRRASKEFRSPIPTLMIVIK